MNSIENRMVVDSEWDWMEAKPICRCTICDSEMYEGNYKYTLDGECICEECIDEYIDDKYREVVEGN